MYQRNHQAFVAAGLVLLAVMSAVPSARAETEWVTETGDILQIALPVLGGGATFFTNPDPDKKWDREGTKQFAWAYGSAWSTTYLLKFLAAKSRPNGNNRTSFPSGHTMSAFAGAAFIDGRYGRNVGIPAYALALFTGYSRVQSNWHYRDDVIAGASIGMIYNWLIVSPQRGNVQFLPTVSAQGMGWQVTVGGGTDDGKVEPPLSDRGHAYNFAFGPAFAISNVSSSQGDGGNEFQLTDLEGDNNPTTTATANVYLRLSQRGRLSISYGPFEARDEGAFNYDVSFSGVQYPAGTQIESFWRYYDFSAHYQYAVAEGRTGSFRLGAGVGTTYSYTKLQTADQTVSSQISSNIYYPFGHLSGAVNLSRLFSLGVQVEGVALNDDWVLDAGVGLIYNPAYSWEIMGGYNFVGRKLEMDDYYNKFQYGVPFLSVARYW